MARIVVLVRHGKAQTRSAEVEDFDRTLTRAGKLALQAAYPAVFSLLPAGMDIAIWASPATRARQTAECAARAARLPRTACEAHDYLWRQDEQAFLDELAADEHDVVVACGHNPFIEDMAARLGGSPLVFKPGAAAAIGLAEPDGAGRRLLWFVQGPRIDAFKNIVAMERVLEAGAETIERRRQEFLASPEDVEAAHQLRVSIRTMRSLLAFAEPFTKEKQARRLQRELRDLVAQTSRLRDMDVLIDQVEALDAPAADLIDACHAIRAEECRKVQDAMASKAAEKTLKRVRDACHRPAWRQAVLQAGIEQDALMLRFAQLLEGFQEEYAVLNMADVEETHGVRKDAKRVRYIAKYYRELLGDVAEAVSRDMEAVQDRLGALCDARALMTLLAGFPRKGLSDEALYDIGMLRVRQEETVLSMLKGSVHEGSCARQ